MGRGAEALGLEGAVDPDTFKEVLAGHVPDGPRLGKRASDGSISHRPGRDLTFSAPKSVSLVALIGGDERIVAAHDRAVRRALDWVERNAAETRLSDPELGRMVRVRGQKTVAATFRHDTSRNLDPQLHTHAVLANMVQGRDGKWRTMANEPLYRGQKLIGMIYRNELAAAFSRDWATGSRRATPTGGSRSRGCQGRSSRRFPPVAPRSRRQWPNGAWAIRRITRRWLNARRS